MKTSLNNKIFPLCEHYKKGLCNFFFTIINNKEYQSPCKTIPKTDSLHCLGMPEKEEIYNEYECQHNRLNTFKDKCLDCQAEYDENTLTWG